MWRATAMYSPSASTTDGKAPVDSRIKSPPGVTTDHCVLAIASPPDALTRRSVTCAARHGRPFAFPGAAVHGPALEEASFIDVEAQTMRRNYLLPDTALHAQTAGGNHQRLFLRLADQLHAPRGAGKAVGSMKDVIAGIEREHRIGVLRFRDRQRIAAIGPFGENPPNHRARNVGSVGRIARGNGEGELAGRDLRNESVRIAWTGGGGR